MTRPTISSIGQSARISYAIMLGLLVLIGWLHLATLVLTALFGYFALRLFTFGGRKWLAVLIYLLLVAGIGLGLAYFSKQAYVTLPKIANTTIPAVVEWAEREKLELPFTDLASLKTLALGAVREKFANIGLYARGAVFEIASLIIGLVVAVSLFLHSKFGTDSDPDTVQGSLYATVSRELARRFSTFYGSFATVIGAQIVISGINTVMTAFFLVWSGYSHIPLILVLTFLFGLLPILGNLMSNTLIIGVGFTVSPNTALAALIFLVVVHKLEYFLNSKIIGDRIKNPMWLILIGLVVGEKLMGVPGMIFAPVVLHYLKEEASRNRANGEPLVEPKNPELPSVG
jgi:predicted PurR-regulated permease PerM